VERDLRHDVNRPLIIGRCQTRNRAGDLYLPVVFESGFCKGACRDAMRMLELDHRLRPEPQDGRGL